MVEIMRMRKIVMLITSVKSENSAKLIRMFIGQFLMGNSMGLIKIHNGGIMRMRKILMLITSVRVQIELRNVRTVFERQ